MGASVHEVRAELLALAGLAMALVAAGLVKWRRMAPRG
jgi:hypothetical protein